MNFKRIIIFLCFFCISNFTFGQDLDKRLQWEINLLAGNTPAAEIVYLGDNKDNYPETGVTSSKTTPGYALQFRLVKPFSKRVYGFIGSSLGVYSHHRRLEISGDFYEEAIDDIYGYFDKERTEYDIYWATLTAGFRIPIINKERHKLLLHLGAGFNFQRFSGGTLSYQTTLDNGEKETYFRDFRRAYSENARLFLPELGLIYQFYFNEKIGINIGLNSIYSDKPYLASGFEIIGDTEFITGSYIKRFSIIGGTLGVVWKFKD
jgi:hypothetical protein